MLAFSTFHIILWTAFQWFLLRICPVGRKAPVVSMALAWFITTLQIASWKLLLRKRLSPLRRLPSPKASHFLLGNIRAIFDAPLGSKISEWFRTIPNNGLIYFRGLLGAEYVVVTSVEAMRDVLSRRAYDFEKTSAFRNYTRRFIGQGLVIEEGNTHKQHRRIIAPIFLERHINAMKPILCSKARQVSRHLFDLLHHHSKLSLHGTANCNPSHAIDISQWASRIALDVACIVGLGVDLNIVSERDHSMFSAYQTIFSCSEEKRKQFLWHNSAPGWLVRLLPSPIDREMDLAYKSIREQVEKIVCIRFQHAIEPGKKLVEIDFLSRLVASGQFNIDECVEQVLIILAAGHESTASTITWIILELAQNPDIQNKLRLEIHNYDEYTTAESKTKIDDLPFLNAVCHETIRLHPAVPMTLRKSVRDTLIQNQPIPVGTYVAVVAEAVNKSKQFWGETALDFYPQRWIRKTDEGSYFDPLGGAPSNYCVETFLHGPRGCIGKSLATAEIVRVVGDLVRNFQIRSTGDAIPEAAGFITVKPRSVSHVQFVAIDNGLLHVGRITDCNYLTA